MLSRQSIRGLFLVLASLLAAPVRAQQSAECAAADQTRQQLEGEYRAAQLAASGYWAQRHPQQLADYEQQLESSIAQGVLAPGLDRIVADLDYSLPAGAGDELRIALQPQILAWINEVAGVLTPDAQSAAEDPELERRLRQAVADALPPMRKAQERVAAIGCYAWMQPDTAPTDPEANTQATAPTGLLARTQAAQIGVNSGPTTPEVCAETAAVLVQLEREEREARDALDRAQAANAPLDDLERALQRRQFQAQLRRQRLRDLNCASLELPAVEPFARREDPVTLESGDVLTPNSAQICSETRRVLQPLERQERETYLLRWAIEDNYHDSFYAIVALRDATAAGKVAAEFDELARLFDIDPDPLTEAQKLATQITLRQRVTELANRARALTGRPSDEFNDPDAFKQEDALFDDPEAPMPEVAPSVRAKEQEIEEAYQQAQYQAQLRRQRLKDLNCDALPTQATASNNGTLKRQTILLMDDYGPPESRQTYGENWTEGVFIGDPPDRRRVRWNFANVPESLSPGDEFTITITADFKFEPEGSESGANYSAGVRTEGLTVIQEENAYLYHGDRHVGSFRYKVPLNAKRVIVALGADRGAGVFVRHCYGECTARDLSR